MKRCNICQKKFFFQSSLDSHTKYDHPRKRKQPDFKPQISPPSFKPTLPIEKPRRPPPICHDDDMPTFVPLPVFISDDSDRGPEPYSGSGGSFAGGGSSGSWDSSNSSADFSNVDSGSDSTASSGD